jgi:hypothetical protein
MLRRIFPTNIFKRNLRLFSTDKINVDEFESVKKKMEQKSSDFKEDRTKLSKELGTTVKLNMEKRIKEIEKLASKLPPASVPKYNYQIQDKYIKCLFFIFIQNKMLTRRKFFMKNFH